MKIRLLPSCRNTHWTEKTTNNFRRRRFCLRRICAFGIAVFGAKKLMFSKMRSIFFEKSPFFFVYFFSYKKKVRSAGFVGVAGALITGAFCGRKHVNASCGADAVIVMAAVKLAAGYGDIFVFVASVKGHIFAHFHQKTASAV